MADTGILVRLSLKLMWFKIAIGNPYGVISLGHSLFNLKSFEVFFQFALKVANSVMLFSRIKKSENVRVIVLNRKLRSDQFVSKDVLIQKKRNYTVLILQQRETFFFQNNNINP